MIDGRRIADCADFVRCSRCDAVAATTDGLVGPHVTPCGSVCSLSSTDPGDVTCDGWCSACMKARTGCDGDPDRPCGVDGCGQCGVHIDGSMLAGVPPMWTGAACRGALPVARFSRMPDRVTCAGCKAKIEKRGFAR